MPYIAKRDGCYLDRRGRWNPEPKAARVFTQAGHAKNAISYNDDHSGPRASRGVWIEIVRVELREVSIERWCVD